MANEPTTEDMRRNLETLRLAVRRGVLQDRATVMVPCETLAYLLDAEAEREWLRTVLVRLVDAADVYLTTDYQLLATQSGSVRVFNENALSQAIAAARTALGEG